ncbi:MAG TPA: hypothetical protein VFX12_10310 [Vicinamibacterales bacterium]|nr:hypothetical protein [Vicinamibacterales bacterium]
MKKFCLMAAAVLFCATPLLAAETWTGTISDSMCGAKHGAGEHAKKMTDRECTEACVTQGAKYVFVTDGKVYQIDNQDFAGLKVHAGHKVALTGDMKDDTITVSKIAMPKAK